MNDFLRDDDDDFAHLHKEKEIWNLFFFACYSPKN